MNSEPRAVYPAIDNLEVMREAKNYNGFLVRLIEKHAQDAEVVLDFGAGDGTFALALRRGERQVVCVEPDPFLHQNLRNFGFEAFTSLQDIPDASVDYVYTLNVLEHIEDDAAAVAQLFSKLKPGGHLLVFVPAFNMLFSSMDRKVGHWRRYRRVSLGRLLHESGFHLEESRYIDSLGFFVTLLFRLVGNRSGDVNRTALKIYDSVIFPLSCILDIAFSRLLGKNVLLVARRP